jgi:hypothetical protein
MNKNRLLTFAPDLRKTPPRRPRETLGGFVIAARMLDKARADLLGINGEYNFYPCGLGAYFWKFTRLDAMNFKEFVASGASDDEVDRWIRENRRKRTGKQSLSGTTKCGACGCANCQN